MRDGYGSSLFTPARNRSSDMSEVSGNTHSSLSVTNALTDHQRPVEIIDHEFSATLSQSIVIYAPPYEFSSSSV